VREFDNFSVCLFVRSFVSFFLQSDKRRREKKKRSNEGERNLTRHRLTDTDLFSHLCEICATMKNRFRTGKERRFKWDERERDRERGQFFVKITL